MADEQWLDVGQKYFSLCSPGWSIFGTRGALFAGWHRTEASERTPLMI